MEGLKWFAVHRCTVPPGVMEGGEGSDIGATIFVSQKSNLANPSIIIPGIRGRATARPLV